MARLARLARWLLSCFCAGRAGLTRRARPASIAAAILAGGLARRMGGVNKAGLRIGAERIVERQLRRLRAVADRSSSCRTGSEEFSDLGVEVVPDAIAGAGPLGGIYTALLASPRERTLIVGCDLPFLTLPLLERLAAAVDGRAGDPAQRTRATNRSARRGRRPAPASCAGGSRQEH